MTEKRSASAERTKRSPFANERGFSSPNEMSATFLDAAAAKLADLPYVTGCDIALVCFGGSGREASLTLSAC